MKYTNVKATSAHSTDEDLSPEIDDSFYSGIQFRDFTDDKEVSKPPFVISIYGDPGAGKSRFIGTAPSPIGVLPLEYKSLPSIIASAREMGKKIILPCDKNGEPINLVRNSRAAILAQIPSQCITADNFTYQKQEDNEKAAARAMQKKSKELKFDTAPPVCCQQHAYRAHANREKACGLMMAAKAEIKTIAIDTFGQFVEDMLFGCYGRNESIMPLDKKSYNQEVRDWLNCLSAKNLILTHHATQIWYEGKPTSKTKPMTTFNKLGHYCTAVLKFTRDRKANVENGDNMYAAEVEDCLVRPDLIGEKLEGTDISFLSLASRVFPEVDIEVWE